jgi:hypothetical protein
VLELDGIKGQQKRFLLWLLQQCAKPKVKSTDIVTEEAIDMLAQRLVTSLQSVYRTIRDPAEPTPCCTAITASH